MTTWLELMLEEIARKKHEAREANEELERRKPTQLPAEKQKDAQSK